MKKLDALLDELSWYLKPPGQGVYAVSTGKKELEAFTKSYLNLAEVPQEWRTHLAQLKGMRDQAFVAILGIPSDCGAGIVRGAARGPEAIRKHWGKAPAFELGDVFVVPHFIRDEMLSKSQIKMSQKQLYGAVSSTKRSKLPVSPISIGKKVYELFKQICPKAKILMLGGDHTVTTAAIEGLFAKKMKDTAIVHFDAHTDLNQQRLGVETCFATWAYDANRRIGSKGRLIQIGIRASARDQAYWEKERKVSQIWADEALQLGPKGLAKRVSDLLIRSKVTRYYLTNDIDGTDEAYAAACGTPEPRGLTRDMVHEVLRMLKAGPWQCIGADMVELAPGLSLSQEKSKLSIETAASYAMSQLELLR